MPDAINATCVRACRRYMRVLERMVWHSKDSHLRPHTLPLEGLWQKDNLIHQGCCRWVSATVSSRVYCEMINKIVGGHCMNTQWQEAQRIEVSWQSILGNVFWGSRTFQREACAVTSYRLSPVACHPLQAIRYEVVDWRHMVNQIVGNTRALHYITLHITLYYIIHYITLNTICCNMLKSY